MRTFLIAREFIDQVSNISTRRALEDALADACARIGLRYFAVSHHVDFSVHSTALRIHNYPGHWAEWYDEHRLGVSDPIHRASQMIANGFTWDEVPRLIAMTASDHALLERSRKMGFGNGVTVPAHVPGERRGSCTFVSAAGEQLPPDALIWAQTVGLFAFQAARRIFSPRLNTRWPRISDRQRDCILLAGRGVRNAEIAVALGIGQQTVLEHLREARARHGVRSRTELVVNLLASGSLCLDDLTRRDD